MATQQQQQQRQGQGREVQFPYDPREELPFVAAGRVERSRQQPRNEGSSDCPFPLRSVSPSGPQDDDRSASLRDAIFNVNPRTLQQMRPYEDPGKLDRFANTQLAAIWGATASNPVFVAVPDPREVIMYFTLVSQEELEKVRPWIYQVFDFVHEDRTGSWWATFRLMRGGLSSDDQTLPRETLKVRFPIQAGTADSRDNLQSLYTLTEAGKAYYLGPLRQDRAPPGLGLPRPADPCSHHPDHHHVRASVASQRQGNTYPDLMRREARQERETDRERESLGARQSSSFAAPTSSFQTNGSQRRPGGASASSQPQEQESRESSRKHFGWTPAMRHAGNGDIHLDDDGNELSSMDEESDEEKIPSHNALHDEKNNRTSSIKLTMTANVSQLRTDMKNSRFVSNNADYKVTSALIDPKLALLDPSHIRDFVMERMQENVKRLVSKNLAFPSDIALLKSLQLFSSEALLFTFFQRNFRLVPQNDDLLDSSATMLAHFLTRQDFASAGGDARTAFTIRPDADYTTERQRVRLLLESAVRNSRKVYGILLHEEFFQYFHPIVEQLSEVNASTDCEWLAYELQFYLANYVNQVDYLTTSRPWTHEVRQSLFVEHVVSKFMQQPAQQQLYMMLGHRRAQAGGKDPFHLFPGSAKVKVEQGEGAKLPKDKKRKSKKAKTETAPPTPAPVVPQTTVTPSVASHTAPYQTRSSGSVAPPPMTPPAEPYCRVFLLESLKLKNTKQIPFKCSKGSACVPGRHSFVTVNDSTSKGDLEAFLATPESLATWLPPNGPVVKVKSCLDKYVRSL